LQTAAPRRAALQLQATSSCLGGGARAPGGGGGGGALTFTAQLAGTLVGIGVAVVGGFLVYAGLKAVFGIRLDPEEEYDGADLTIHKISATPDRDSSW